MAFTLEMPVFYKELRSRTRGWKRWAHHLVVASPFLYFLWIVLLFFAGSADAGTDPVRGLIMLEFLVCLLLVPAYAGSAFARERQQHTLEALFFTPLSTFSIVLGKLCSTLTSLGLVLVGALPLVGVWSLFEPARFGAVLLSQCVILATGGFLAALGMFLSTWYRHTITAIAIAYGATALTVGLVPLLLAVESFLHNTFWRFRLEGLTVGICCLVLTIGTALLFTWLLSEMGYRLTRWRGSLTFFLLTSLLLTLPCGYVLFTTAASFPELSRQPELLLVGNPLGALLQLNEAWEDYARVTPWPSYQYSYLYLPVTSSRAPLAVDPFTYVLSGLLAPLLGAWLMIRLTMRRVDQLRLLKEQ